MQFSGVTISGGFSVAPIAAPVVPTDPYWADVSLLMNTTSTNNQTNNTFLDGSTNNFTITRTGTPTQGSFTPFTVANGASYSTATNGGSGYFPGSSYLTAPSSTNFAFGTGDFTMECWVRFSSIGGGITPLMQTDVVGSSTSDKVWLGVNNNVLTLGQHATPNAATTAWTPSTNIWYHVAAVRQSGTVKLFIDGVQKSVTNSTIFSSTSFGQNGFAVGAVSTPVYLTGYMSSVRVVKGTAVYTAGFTPSTTPLTAISGTSLLLNYTNAGMYDAATKNNLLGVGDTKVSTTQSKFAPTSVAFDGTGDYLTALSNTIFTFGTGDFTVETWVYLNNVTGSKFILDMRPENTDGVYPVLYMNGATATWYINSAARLTGTVSATSWTHIAISRSSGVSKMFIDGVQAGSNYTDANNYLSAAPAIGSARFPTGSNTLNGFLQDLRLTKGVARYTANFTPPTTAFPTAG
jgi:hypothetical protein